MMEILKGETVYKIADGVRTREESFGLLVISKQTPALSLNKDSEFVWKLIDGNNTILDITKSVLEEFSGDDAEKRIETLLCNLLKLGLIEETK
jgi:putative mycofactocin binding protein MftB